MIGRKKRGSAPLKDTHAPGAAAPAGADRPPSSLPASGDQAQLGFDDLLPLAIPDEQRRGVGRPKGAANIRTNTTFQTAVSRYGDPLIATIALGNMPTRALIKELREIASDCGLKLGATVMEIVRFQEECRKNAMPYGHAKRAATDEKGETVVPIIGIGSVNVAVGEQSGRSLEDVIDAEIIEQSQEDSDAADK